MSNDSWNLGVDIFSEQTRERGWGGGSPLDSPQRVLLALTRVVEMGKSPPMPPIICPSKHFRMLSF